MDYDALNKAYDDEVSRLFHELCAGAAQHGTAVSNKVGEVLTPPGLAESLGKFSDGMLAADAAYDAVNKMWREKTAGMAKIGDVRRFGQ